MDPAAMYARRTLTWRLVGPCPGISWPSGPRPAKPSAPP
jgi:hypothetical protein